MLDPLSLYALASLGATGLGLALTLPRMAGISVLGSTAEGARERPGDGIGRPLPSTAVVVAAKDEAATIEPALRALLGDAKNAYSVYAVNDRSGDATGAILERLAAEYERLRVLHVEELPRGWLGKNHALGVGADAATRDMQPEFILFTDADVHFVPGGVAAAVHHAEENGLDHLAGAPRVMASSFALAGQVATFGILFGLFTRPWSVPNPQSRAYVGIGALNLVRRSAYEHAGGHDAVRLRIDDDLRLGKRIKESGGHSAFAFATEVSSITWYPTLRAMLKGLHKNAFAGIDFRASVAVLATVFLAAGFIAPFVAPFLAAVPAVARAAFAASAALLLFGAAESAASAKLPRRTALFLPIGVALFLAVLWRSALGALITGRIVWRDTSYSLKELKGEARRRAPLAPTESA